MKEIKSRFDDKVLYTHPRDTCAGYVLKAAIAAGTDLQNADLKGEFFGEVHAPGVVLEGADLLESNFDHAELVGANLVSANLHRVSFYHSNLRDADLRYIYAGGVCFAFADLRGADLRGATFTGGDFHGARLEGAWLQWHSHELLSSILMNAAGDHALRRSIAGLIALSRDWCWNHFMKVDHPERDWAVRELAKYIKVKKRGGLDCPVQLEDAAGKLGCLPGQMIPDDARASDLPHETYRVREHDELLEGTTGFTSPTAPAVPMQARFDNGSLDATVIEDFRIPAEAQGGETE